MPRLLKPSCGGFDGFLSWRERSMSDGERVDSPERPDTRCVEHDSMCETVHGLLGRLMVLEQRVQMLEEKE